MNYLTPKDPYYYSINRVKKTVIIITENKKTGMSDE